VSENGPREGTKDLPRRPPEAGHRGVDPDSTTGIAYSRLARTEKRRRDELEELARSGLPFHEIASRYAASHPLERDVTPEEIGTLDRRPRSRD
jgi:hypothetical protein